MRPAQENASSTVRNRLFTILVGVVTACCLGLSFAFGQAEATSGSNAKFVRFEDFLAATRDANAGDYLARPTRRVKDAASFEEMRRHILTMYDGIEISHSFMLGASHFDCVPVMQQPSVRLLGIKTLASPPPPSMLAPAAEAGEDPSGLPVRPASQIDPDNPFDEFGNSVACEANTIPMRRLTLDEMTRFETLRQFFQKSPDEAGNVLAPTLIKPPIQLVRNPVATVAHKYSVALQNVNALGGNSILNLWSPYVNTTKSEGFSLSQEWWVAGTFSGSDGQTAEVGWQNFPTKYGQGENSVLFNYWTADNYNNTGCYNLECAAFVQIAAQGTLGAKFSNYSTLGGTQYEFSAEYRLYNGNWWLAIQGTWLGYYPGSLYSAKNTGELAKNATQIQFGTESTGTTLWPPEGSGNWPSKGFGQAAYQRNLFYVDTSGNSQWDQLTTSSFTSTKCYNIAGPYSVGPSGAAPGWTVNIYDGGPGGSGC